MAVRPLPNSNPTKSNKSSSNLLIELWSIRCSSDANQPMLHCLLSSSEARPCLLQVLVKESQHQCRKSFLLATWHLMPLMLLLQRPLTRWDTPAAVDESFPENFYDIFNEFLTSRQVVWWCMTHAVYRFGPLGIWLVWRLQRLLFKEHHSPTGACMLATLMLSGKNSLLRNVFNGETCLTVWDVRYFSTLLLRLTCA